MIQSFGSQETEGLFQYRHSRRFRAIERIALRKLLQLHAATELRILASPPGNRLEALRGDRKGQHSVRINDQWRVCFVLRAGHCYGVETADYHKQRRKINMGKPESLITPVQPRAVL